MKKIYLPLFMILFIFFMTLSQGKAEIVPSVELEPENILDKNEITVNLDGNEIDVSIIDQDDTLFIDSNFLKEHFNNYDEVMKSTPVYAGSFTDKSGQKHIYLPAFISLRALGVNYNFTNIYGKIIITITGEGGSSYSSITYSTSITPPGYGYYSPPVYKTGIYFGNFGTNEYDNSQMPNPFNPTTPIGPAINF